MKQQEERRQSERLLLRVPIRVTGTNAQGVEFSEDSCATVVNKTGARIALKTPMAGGEVIRIASLDSFREADFKVVGRVTLSGAEPGEYGVECLEAERNVWSIEFPPPLPLKGFEAGALLECRACHSQALMEVSLIEVHTLDSSAIIARECPKCGKTTYWTHAEPGRRSREIPPAEPTAPPEKRKQRRLAMKLPILVRNQKGVEEVTKTENVSKGGVGVYLAIDLLAEEKVTVVCPYTAGAKGFEQQADVRRRSAQLLGGRRLYGLRYAR